MINRAVPIDELESAVREVADAICRNAPLSIAASKYTIGQILTDKEDRDYDEIKRLSQVCFDSNDYKEGREAFMERAWAFKSEAENNIISQLRVMGVSCDWERQRFTLDEGLSKAVREAFVSLYEEGLIYRANRLINWCPTDHTALSDLEVDHQDLQGKIQVALRKNEIGEERYTLFHQTVDVGDFGRVFGSRIAAQQHGRFQDVDDAVVVGVAGFVVAAAAGTAATGAAGAGAMGLALAMALS